MRVMSCLTYLSRHWRRTGWVSRRDAIDAETAVASPWRCRRCRTPFGIQGWSGSGWRGNLLLRATTFTSGSASVRGSVSAWWLWPNRRCRFIDFVAAFGRARRRPAHTSTLFNSYPQTLWATDSNGGHPPAAQSALSLSEQASLAAIALDSGALMRRGSFRSVLVYRPLLARAVATCFQTNSRAPLLGSSQWSKYSIDGAVLDPHGCLKESSGRLTPGTAWCMVVAVTSDWGWSFSQP